MHAVIFQWFLLASLTSCVEACILKPTRYRTNNLRNPLAIAENNPVFSWALAFQDGSYVPPQDEVGIDHYQSAYRIICTEIRGNNENGEVLWDSGKLHSRESLQIEYRGKPLKSLQRIKWEVQVWDEDGIQCDNVSDDELPWFETGLLDEKAWDDAEWIARYGPLPANVSLCSMMAETDENQAPRFRAEIHSTLFDNVVQARAYIVGLGYYQLYVDGAKVGDAMLDTGWTTYSKRLLYAAHDVSSMLEKKDQHKNITIGVELGNGWWNPLSMLIFGRINLRKTLITEQNRSSSRPMFRLHIYGFRKDGSAVSLLKSFTGASSPWLTSGSPTTFNDIYLGEKYDGRLEPVFDGWDTSAYRPKTSFPCGCSWRAPVKADSSGLGKLEAQEIPPIRRQKTLRSALVRTNNTLDGGSISIIDTGINHAGSCRIQVKNQDGIATGQKIYLTYGELLTSGGDLNVFTSVAGHITSKNPNVPCQPDVAAQKDTITLGAGSLDWTPSWSWHGFRYIEVTLPPTVHVKDFSVECFTMRSDMDVVANFSSSDPWLDDLRTLVRTTYDSNLMSIQSDCPHRERYGYGGDALGCGEAGLSIYDFSGFYRKRILDYNDAQRVDKTGKLTGFTETAPYVDVGAGQLGPETGPIGWETYQPEGQLWLYKYYGDSRTMNQSLKNTQAYIDLLDSEPKGIERGLGDWLATHSTNVAFTGRGFQRMSYLAYANITEILGMPKDLSHYYRQKAEALVENVNRRFLRAKDNPGAYSVGTGEREGNVTETGQGMALFNGFLSFDLATKREALLQLAENARSASYIKGACQPFGPSSYQPECDAAIGGPGPHLTAGMLGIKWVLMALADGGLNDLAYDMIKSKTYPGFGWMMNNQFTNATTVWESFYFSDFRKSHNHPMFGSTETWLLQSVAGIQPHPSARGMDHVIIRPNPPSQLQHASASFESPRGVFSVSWKRQGENGSIDTEAIIPPNCRATVHVPSAVNGEVMHQGIPISGTWIPSLAAPKHGSIVVNIGSGYHEFESRLLNVINPL